MVQGGHGTYGNMLGILMLDSKIARIPGDVGNATTYKYPVMYKIIQGANLQSVVLDGDPALLEPFVRGARELADAGCKAITTSCGFLAMFQREMAAAVDIPVFTSSLLQVGMVYRMLKPGQKVGVLTASKTSLNDKHFESAGISDIPMVVAGLDDSCFIRAFDSASGNYDLEQFTREMEEAAAQLVRDKPEVGAIVMECTNMPPFAAAVQRKVGLPVFDYVTLANYVASALIRTEFQGFM